MRWQEVAEIRAGMPVLQCTARISPFLSSFASRPVNCRRL